MFVRINAGGVHLIFYIFFGAFIQGRRLHEGGVYYKIEKKLHFYISMSMIRCLLLSEKQHFLLHQHLESVIRLNGLGRSGSSNTLSCDINCSLPFWQGSPSLKQWIKPSFEPLFFRFKPHDLNKWENGAFIQRGRL